jgi:hypothetical protein
MAAAGTCAAAGGGGGAGNTLVITGGTAAGAGGQGVAPSSGGCASSWVDVAVGGTSSIRLAFAESWPQVNGTLVAHNASDASAMLQARRELVSGDMLDVQVLSLSNC